MNDIKRFAMNGVIFLAFLGVLLLLVNQLYLTTLLSHTRLYRAEQSYEEFLASSPEPMLKYGFFGTSPTLNGANPAQLNGSFTLGAAGEYYLHMYYRVRRTLERDKVHLDTAIIEVSPFSLSNAMVDDQRILANVWYYRKSMSYEEMQESTPATLIELMSKGTIPYIGKGIISLEFAFIEQPTAMYRGWENNTISDAQDSAERARSAEFLKRRQVVNGTLIDPQSLEYFERTLRLLREHNVTVILIRYPAQEEYNRVMNDDGLMDEHYTRVLAIAGNITLYRYLDYHDLLDDHPEYFGDSVHLTGDGSTALMLRLREDLEKEASSSDVDGRK